MQVSDMYGTNKYVLVSLKTILYCRKFKFVLLLHIPLILILFSFMFCINKMCWLICYLISLRFLDLIEFVVLLLYNDMCWFSYFNVQMVYVLCVYNKKEKYHQIMVCADLSCLTSQSRATFIHFGPSICVIINKAEIYFHFV